VSGRAARLAALEDALRAPDQLARQCEADADRILAALPAVAAADGGAPFLPERTRLLERSRRAHGLPAEEGEGP